MFEPKDEATNAIVYNAAKDYKMKIATDAIPNVDYWIGIDDIDEGGYYKYNSDIRPYEKRIMQTRSLRDPYNFTSSAGHITNSTPWGYVLPKKISQ